MTDTDEWTAGPAPVESYDVLTRVARALRVKDADMTGTLEAIVTQATETLEPATWAGLIELEHGRLVPRATTGEPPRILDRLQQETGDGPCVEAAREQRPVTVDDTKADQRWPAWAERAVDLGVGTVLCAPLWVDHRRLGTLSLYGESAGAFGGVEHQLLELYATLAAMAMADGQRVTNLTAALDSRDLIGQAKGVLIERFKISAEEAFTLLSETSQKTNRKLVTVAEDLVRTGDLNP